jgi:ABC-type glycerol-3-phosphate transport system substrate-binding protein
MRKGVIFLVIVGMIVGLPLFGAKEAAAEKSKILWWSHWANEPSKRAVIEQVAQDYMMEHPDVEIEITWWDKNPLQDAWRTVVAAGGAEGPDIVTDPAEDMVEQAQAGVFVDLGEDFPWDNFAPGTKEAAQFGGMPGYYKFNIGKSIHMIFYNKEIFEECGITVPEDFTFTQDEFVHVVKKVNAKGYAGVANAIGNRPYPALFPVYDAFVNLVGIEEAEKYITGRKSWDSDEARQILEWTAELRDAGMWPDTFATMTIDEFHVYFHTQKKAAMLYIPSWYTGRAFQSEDKGGQSPDFHFGMLRYPRMNGAVNDQAILGGFESGYVISKWAKHPDIAKDILAFFAQPKYGALWELYTDIPSVIKYTTADIPADAPESKWGWYHEEIAKVYGPLPMGIINFEAVISGDFANARETALNQGLPQGLITVDEAIEMLDEFVEEE